MIVCTVLLLAAAPSYAIGSVNVSDAWIRAMPEGIPSGGYFNLHNDTGRDMVLTGARAPDCESLMLHKSETTGGMSTMHHVNEVDVPAGGGVTFAPGGYHLMCMGAGPAIKPGAKVPVTLLFKDGSKIVAAFSVRDAAGK